MAFLTIVKQIRQPNLLRQKDVSQHLRDLQDLGMDELQNIRKKAMKLPERTSERWSCLASDALRIARVTRPA